MPTKLQAAAVLFIKFVSIFISDDILTLTLETYVIEYQVILDVFNVIAVFPVFIYKPLVPLDLKFAQS